MSSRALRKLQKQQEEAAAAESDEEHDATMPQQKKMNAFDLLNAQEDGGESESEASVAEAVEIPEKPIQSTMSPAEGKKKRKSKKKSKKKNVKKQEASSQAEDSKTQDDQELDEIDRALHELSVKQSTPSGDAVLSHESHRNRELAEKLDSFLAIEPKHLNALTEMKKLFGSIVLENRREYDTQQDRSWRRRGQRRNIDLGTALTGRHSVGSRGQEIAGATLRKNILMQSKDEWPRAPSGGLGMEMVAEYPLNVAEYKLVHNSNYQDTQRQFDMCVESMEPTTMIQHLQLNPYHLSTLLQVSEIAKYQGDHSVSADLLERALFNIGRSVHSSFGNRLKQGKARMDFNIKENRELYLAGWRYMINLGMKGTWRTAYEWAKLLLSLDSTDPYAISLIIDQLAIRGRELDHFIELYSNAGSTYGWDRYPNIQCSLPLAHFLKGNPKESRHHLREAMSKLPWIFCRLAQELNISPVPKQIWGVEAPNQEHKLYTELYIARAKDNWNTPEAISLLVEVADSITRSDNVPEAPEVTLSVARHVILSDIKPAITLLPPGLVSGRMSVSDPLPPGQPLDEDDSNFNSPHEHILDVVRRQFGDNERIMQMFQERLGDREDEDEDEFEEEIDESRIEQYLYEEGLEQIRTFILENGVDRGNWDVDEFDGNPITQYISRLCRMPRTRWHDIINDVASDLNISFLWELLMEELRLQTEEHDDDIPA